MRERGRRHTALEAACLVALAFLAVVGVLVAVPAPPRAHAAVRDPFEPPIFELEENGAILLVGNSQMSCPTSANTCATARASQPPTTNNSNIDNNNFTMAFLDLDALGATTNSTSAELAMPAGSTVLYARLVWGGRQTAGSGGSAATGTIGQVKFRPPGQAGYTTLTGTVVDPGLTGTDGRAYQASLDVTSLVQAAGNGTYWVGDIRAATGADRYAGWSLVVAFRNPSQPLRNLAIFEGFADVTTNPGNTTVTVPISGFLTPAAGTVNASVGFVTWEGDRGLVGEQVRLNGTILSDPVRPSTNFFNSGVSDGGANVTARNTNFPNNFGVDIARVVANGVLTNNQTATTVVLTTNEDFYYPGIITTQIDLYTPAFNPVSKTATNLSGNSPARAGDTLEYQLSYTNTGMDFADGAVVTDALPPNVTFVPASIVVTASPGGVNNGPKTDAPGDDIAEYIPGSRTVRLRIGTGATATAGGTLAPNTTVTLRFRVTLDRASSGTTVINGSTLAYRARTIARDYTFVGNTVDTPVAALADIAVTKASAPTSQVAGRIVQYPVTVTNNGPNAAAGVTMSDTLPLGATFVSASAPAGTSCAATGQVVACTVGTLANGAAVTVTISATIDPGAVAGTVVNTATVASATSDDITANNSASASTQITSSADLVVAKTAPVGGVPAGRDITYTVTVTNDGPSTASTVRLTDPLPAGTTVPAGSPPTSPTGSCAVVGGSVECSLASLAPGASMVATITLRPGPGFVGTALTNTASVASLTPDPVAANNSATVTRPITRLADVAVTKSVIPTTVTAGSAVTYTITASNAGPSDAENVVVADPAVAGLTVTGANATIGSCTVAAGAVSCAIGLLNPGASTTITVQATVDPARPAGPLANTATVSTSTPQSGTSNDTATATLPVTVSADVSIVKTGPGTILAGQQVTYSLTARNAGPSQATGVTIADTLPAGLAFVSSPDGCVAAGQVVTCAVGVLGVAAAATRTIVAVAAGDVPATVTNTATVTASSPDPTPANNTSSFTSSATAVADVAVTKSVSPSPLVAGAAVTYTAVVTNSGPSTALGVTMSDPMPPGVAASTAVVTGGAGTCTVAPTVTCPFGTLTAGESRTVTITATVGSAVAAGTSIANTATVASTGPTDPTTSNNTSTAVATVSTVADLAVVLTPSSTTVAAGAFVDYTAVIRNNGPSTAINSVATGQVPDGLIPEIGSSGGACTLVGSVVTCNLGDLPPGAVITIPLRARVSPDFAPGPISATALIGSRTPDPVGPNDRSTATIQVVGSADLVTTKSVPTPLIAGAEASYTITVRNDGPSDAMAAQVVDTLPAELLPLSAVATTGTCTISGQTVTCPAGRLPAGSSLTVALLVRVSTAAGATVTNTATASSATTDPAPGSNTATTVTDVVQAAALDVAKSASPEPVVAGASLTYTIVVTNSGPSDAADVTLADALPDGLVVLPNGISGDVCTVTPTRTAASCSFGTIPAGESRTVTINASVPEGAANGSVITNTVTVSSPTPDLVPGPRSATVDSNVQTLADVVMLKTSLDDAVVAGDAHGYLLSVSNEGPSVAEDVVVVDELPPGTTFVSAVPSRGSCAAAAGTVTCTIGDLNRGAVVTIQLTIRLAADLGGRELANTSSASTSTSDPVAGNNSSTIAQLVNRRADLALTKSITSGPITAGANVTYALQVVNNGPSNTTNVIIEDPIPSATTLVSTSASDGGTCELTTIGTTPPVSAVRCSWAAVAVGETRTASMVVAVPADLQPGTTISNTATAVSDANDPTPNSATAAGSTVASADVSATKSLISGTAIAGGTVRWQIVVSNAGPSQAAAVTLADPAPPGVTFSGVTTTTGTCTTTGGLSCELGTFDVGTTATVTVTGTLAPDLVGPTLTNTATAASPTDDPDLGNNLAASTTAVATSADVSVVKVAGPGPFVAGAAVDWTLTVTNAGPSDANAVEVIDEVPAGLAGVTATSSAGTCNITATVTCALGTLPDEATATITISGTLVSDLTVAEVVNAASVRAGTPDPDATNNSSSVTTSVETSADLRVSKAGPASAVPGEPLTWTVTVTNEGPSVAQGTVLTDTLPAGLLNPRATVDGLTCPITLDEVRCELGAMAVSDGTAATDVVVTITGTVDPALTAASVTNAAVVDAATPDPDPSDNDAAATTTLAPSADVSITKTATTPTVVPGTSVEWTLVVQNAGPSVAQSVTVTDGLPAGVTVQSAAIITTDGPVPCAVDGADISCLLGAVAPGVPVRIVVSGLVDQGLAATTLENTATLTTATADPSIGDHTATATSPVVPSADVVLLKSVDLSGGLPVAGGPVTFLIAVENRGPSAAASVSLADLLPPEVDPGTVTVDPATSCAFDPASGLVSCDLGMLDRGDRVDITISGTLAPDADDVENTAGASSPTADPDLDNNTSTATAVSDQLADVAVTKSGPGALLAGERVTWQVELTNAGPSAATDVVLTDVLPAGLADILPPVSSDPDLVCAGTASVTCTIASLGAGGRRTVVLSALVPPGFESTELHNTATSTAGTPDPDGGNNAAGASTTIGRQAALGVTKSADPTPLIPGRDGAYAVTVSNAGPSDAAAVVAEDIVPAGLAPTGPAVTTHGTCTYAGLSLTCQLGTITAGTAATILIPVNVDSALAATTVDNTASATAITPAPPDAPPASGSVTSDVTPLADLTVVKTAPQRVTAGSPLRWSITVSNGGPSVAPDVVVSDVLPPRTEGFGVVASQGSCTRAADTLTCPLGALAPGATATITIEGIVPADLTAPTLDNAASATSPAAEPDPAVPDGRSTSTSTAVDTSADVSVTKTATVSPAVPGEPVAWTVTVINSGPSVARDVHVVDLLPPGVSDVVLSGSAGVTCDSTAGTCDVALLGVGPADAAAITVTGGLPADSGAAAITNVAIVTASTPDPDAGNNEASTTTPVGAVADVSITKAAAPDPAVRGAPLTWTLTVTNNGPSVARAVTVDDVVPAGLSDVVAAVDLPATCTTEVTCALGDLAPGAVVAVTITGTVAPDLAAVTLTNTATVSSPTADRDPTDNTATSTTPVTSVADLGITKSGPATAVAGSTVAWTVTVTNAGPSVATGVVVTDVPPAELLGAVAVPGQGSCDPALVCTLGTIAVGATVTIEISGTVDPAASATSISNVASVASAATDPDVSDNTASASTVVGRSADVSVVKAVDPTSLVPGRPATFTLAVTNAGPSTATGVVVTDDVPAGLALDTVDTDTGTCTTSGQLVTCALGVLDAGATALVTIGVDVAPDVDAATWTNTAAASSTTPDPVPGNNTSTVGGALAPIADLRLTKVADRSSVRVGETISWTIGFENLGPSTARDVIVVDALPAGLTAVVTAGDGTCDPLAGTSLTCRWASVEVASTGTVTITATLRSGTGSLVNTASVSSAAVDPDAADNTASTSTPILADTAPAGDVAVTKVLTEGGTVAGRPVAWTITVSNAGPATARDIVVVDAVPAPVTSVTATPSAGACAVTPGTTGATVTCRIGDVPGGGASTVVVRGTIDPAFRGAMTNSATATGPDTDPEISNNTGSVTATVLGELDLRITKTADRSVGVVGETATFTITAINDGPSAAADAYVDDVLPAGLTFVAARPDAGTYDRQTGRWDIGAMSVGVPVRMQLDVRLALVGVHVNRVTITYYGPPGNTETRIDNNTASATVVVTAAPAPTPAPTLPVTGASTWVLVRWAALVLALGAALLLAGRWRTGPHVGASERRRASGAA